MTAAPLAPPAPFTPAFYRDPHPCYDALRARGPATPAVGPSGSRFWLVPGYEDVRTLLTHPAVRKDEWRRPDLRERHQPDPDKRRETDVRIRANMLNADPPEHQRLRYGTQQALSPARAEALRPVIERIADTHLDALAAKGPGPHDLRAEFTYPFAISVITGLLGLDDTELPDFRSWFETMMVQRSAPAVKEVSAAIADYAESVVDRRAAHPTAGLIGALAAPGDAHAPLTRHELASTVFLLLIAGVEAANSLANGVLALLRHPGQLAALRADRSLLPGAIEETLRWDGSFRAVGPRYTAEPVRLGELVIPEGEFLLLTLQAANRDPARFPDPHRFDITRADGGHLAMGYGAHRCVGSKLAYAQLETVHARLLDRFPALRLAVPAEETSRRPSLTMNWLDSLPVLLW
ncbi:cytochrome P450 [Streptomyces sp. NBC_00091]|uniref:cytochrome P450 family protein n=1 Tax=Streptomyces sp. NBC_00091 TaxID=2975648 RepID=UPI0022541541|nr:cytochrome P450 [Streptomyces sp. NBC_00091]MCX5375103.1 cytochrome P450 [Streptomyces sp. NBC_00091]